jgi:hypothetical protein
MDAKIGHIAVNTSSVINQLHPPIVQVMEALADNGTLAEGLLVAKDTDGMLIAHEAVTGVNMTGDINGTNKTYTATLAPAPVLRGTVVVDNNNTSAQQLKDDGNGNMVGDGTGLINYETGEISVTFTTAPASGKTVKVGHKTRPLGVLVSEIDTADDDAAPVIRHGCVALAALLTGADAPDDEDIAALAAIGIFAL